MVTDRGTYVRSTYCERIRKTPELSMTIGRGANLTCFAAKTICWVNSHGETNCQNNEQLGTRSSSSSSTSFAWGILSQVAKE